jgi:histidinol phosphatase-like PHP family hydrolase
MDTNAIAGALLHDLAAVQTVREKTRAFDRAARTILQLDDPLESLVGPDGTLQKIAGIGPSSLRVIVEVLETGGSPTVEQAVASSPKRGEIQRSRDARTNFLSRAAVVRILADDSLDGPSIDDYHGDFQMHSEWSDGADSLLVMATACLERGYQYCAITDHSHGLRIAGGLSASDLARQHAEIDQVNRELDGRFRLLKGVEANLAADGSLDLTADDLRSLEIVVAAPHAALREAANHTARIVRAVQTPGVHILGHPRGRKLGSRAGLVADWDVVFRHAAKTGVAIEIDGDPTRQDLDHALARQAADAGCFIALDSDAHNTHELRYADTAIAHARLAGIQTKLIVNCWPLELVLEWSRARQYSSG